MRTVYDAPSVASVSAEAFTLHPNPAWPSRWWDLEAGVTGMKKPRPRCYERLSYVHLPKRPLFDDMDIFRHGYVPIRIVVSKGRLLVLCPVNRLNDIPKRLSVKVQADFLVENNLVNNSALLTKDGRIYSWSQDTL